MGARGKPSGTPGKNTKQEPVRKKRRKSRRAVMEATRSRLGLDRKQGESAEKTAMYGAWLDRAQKQEEPEESEEETEQSLPSVYTQYVVVCAVLAALCLALGCLRRGRKR